MAYQSPKIQFVKDNVIRVYHPVLLEPQTYLTSAVVATNTALTVKNNAGFSNTDPQDLVLFEGFNNELAEIKRVNGVITAGTALTVQALTYGHGVGVPLYKVLFDQFEVRGSNTDAATAASTNGTIVQFNSSNTTPINLTGEYTDFIITGTTFSYYGVRFYNSLATTTYYSAFSDGIAATDYEPNTIGFVRRNALASLNDIIDEKLFTTDWIYDQIYHVEQDVAKELKRWSWLENFDVDLGNLSTGDRSMSLPTDIEDNKTNKSIYGIRVANGESLEYITPRQYEEIMNGVAWTTLATTAAVGATTMVLTDSRDFADSGTINIVGTNYSYTGNTRSTNTLTGFTALSTEITSGVNIWQNVTFGEPLRYTIKEGVIYWDTPPSSSFNGRNVWIDYYQKVTRKNSDGDELTVNDPNLVQAGLEMMLKKRKNRGELSLTDEAVQQYELLKAKLVKNEESGKLLRLVPRVPGRLYRKMFNWFR